jgi:hypothetical protein
MPQALTAIGKKIGGGCRRPQPLPPRVPLQWHNLQDVRCSWLKPNSTKGISGSNIVGWYIDATDATRGFLYNGATYQTLDVPGQSQTQAGGLYALP